MTHHFSSCKVSGIVEVIATLSLHAGLNDLKTIRTFVETELAARHVHPDMLYDIIFSLNEITTNVLVHGYPHEEGWMQITLACDHHDLYVTIRDQAPAFNPTHLPDPDITLPLELRPLGGLGVYLTKELMDQVSHRVTEDGGNEITLLKKAVL